MRKPFHSWIDCCIHKSQHKYNRLTLIFFDKYSSNLPSLIQWSWSWIVWVYIPNYVSLGLNNNNMISFSLWSWYLAWTESLWTICSPFGNVLLNGLFSYWIFFDFWLISHLISHFLYYTFSSYIYIYIYIY